jgi:hypothetical protein
MNTFKLLRDASIATTAVLMLCSLPVQARFDGESWEPKVGEIGYQEEQLARELTDDFKAHLIDSNELAMLTRDLDVIRVKEDALRMNHHGLDKKDEERVLKLLAKFQQNLNKAVGDKSYTLAEAPTPIPNN